MDAPTLAGPPAHPETETHCPYCALQCGMKLGHNGASWEVKARDFPTNRGGLCRKGWAAAELLSAPGRLTAPLIRSGPGEPQRETTWAEALDFVVSRLRALIRSYGRDSLGVF
ncbi:MAG TPA: hypothetical protein VNN72_03200, partial [Polyangiaceae bacterium]|nr:hypothetical protein [Polyangiaceae bacterium]